MMHHLTFCAAKIYWFGFDPVSVRWARMQADLGDGYMKISSHEEKNQELKAKISNLTGDPPPAAD